MHGRDFMILGNFWKILWWIFLVNATVWVVWVSCLWDLISWASVVGFVWFLSWMIDYLEFFVLIYYMEFLVVYVEIAKVPKSGIFFEFSCWVFTIRFSRFGKPRRRASPVDAAGTLLRHAWCLGGVGRCPWCTELVQAGLALAMFGSRGCVWWHLRLKIWFWVL